MQEGAGGNGRADIFVGVDGEVGGIDRFVLIGGEVGAEGL